MQTHSNTADTATGAGPVSQHHYTNTNAASLRDMSLSNSEYTTNRAAVTSNT